MNDNRLSSANVGNILGISATTVVRYLNESRPGKRYEHHPFPEPDGRDGRQLFWLADRREELEKWADSRPGTGYHAVYGQ